MSEKLDVCEKCNHQGPLKRLPLFPVRIKKKKKEKQVGEVVKSHIEEAKEDMKKEKQNLQKEYKP